MKFAPHSNLRATGAWHKAGSGYPQDILACDKYTTDLISAEESNHENNTNSI